MKTNIFTVSRALHALARCLPIACLCYSGTAAATELPSVEHTDALERPNILLIVADDLGYSDLGVMGSEISTPNLDRLAGSGMLLTNFHAAPACTASRAALLTGVDHHQAGVGNMKVLMAPNQVGQPGYEGVLNDRVVSFPTLLRDAGYHTYISGKWDLGSEIGQWPVDRGFERSFALLEGGGNHFNDGAVVPLLSAHYVRDDVAVERPDGYSSDLFTDELLAFLKADREDGKPFFAYAAYTAPHWPLQAPVADIEKHEVVYQEGWDRLRAARFARMKHLGIVDGAQDLPPAWPGVPAWDALPPERQRLEAKKMAVYAAMVENMDSNIGRLLDSLSEEGRLDNTVVIFLSDNGPDAANLQWQLPGGMAPALRWVYRTVVSLRFDNSLANLGKEDSHFSYGVGWAQLGATPLFMHKGLVSEGGIRVPLIVAQPSVYPEGRRSNAVTSLHDIAPTLLEMAGGQAP
jgi:arylsulfatase A-like enzyme